MSDSPEQAIRPTAAQPTGKYGAGILSILLLAGGFLLLFIPAMWMLAALKWADKPLLVAVALLTLAAVALLTLTGWCLAGGGAGTTRSGTPACWDSPCCTASPSRCWKPF